MAGYGPGTPQWDNMSPALQSIVSRIIQESNGQVWLGSGWRSPEQQRDLYSRWISGQYNVPAVARPGTSHHESGTAVDFGGNLELAQRLGLKYGLRFNVDGEAWHGELTDAAARMTDAGYASSVPRIVYNLDDPEMSDPKEVIANRLHSIMRMIGGSPVNPAFTMGPEAETDELTSQFAPMELSGFDDNDMPTYKAGDPKQYGTYAQSLFNKYGWGPDEYPALVKLWNKESGDPSATDVTWNPLAQNPNSSAFGIAQFLDGTWGGVGGTKTADPYRQIDYGAEYIAKRFGSPSRALMFHNTHGWY